MFEIEPRHAILGPRDIQDFKVTFNPNRAVGGFKSIVMATPALTSEELLIAEDKEEFMKKGSLGIVSFNIMAEIIEPVLTIDKKTRIDGENHMNFKYWAYRGDNETPSAILRLIYTNETKSDLVFNLTSSGPF